MSSLRVLIISLNDSIVVSLTTVSSAHSRVWNNGKVETNLSSLRYCLNLLRFSAIASNTSSSSVLISS